MAHPVYSYRRETARQLRIYAQLTRCFSAVAELLLVVVVVVVVVVVICVCSLYTAVGLGHVDAEQVHSP